MFSINIYFCVFLFFSQMSCPPFVLVFVSVTGWIAEYQYSSISLSSRCQFLLLCFVPTAEKRERLHKAVLRELVVQVIPLSELTTKRVNHDYWYSHPTLEKAAKGLLCIIIFLSIAFWRNELHICHRGVPFHRQPWLPLCTNMNKSLVAAENLCIRVYFGRLE